MLPINQLYCGDNLKLIRLIDRDSVQLTCTSPPYSNIRTYQGFSWDFENLAKELFRVTCDGGVVVWVVGDQYVKGGRDLESFRQGLYFKDIGFTIHDIMIYQKRNFSHPSFNRYHQVWEMMIIVSKGKPRVFNGIKDRKNLTAGAVGNLGVNTFTEKDGSKSIRSKKITAEFGMRHNVWLGNTRGQEDMCVKLNHPALMPKWIARDHIITWTNEGDIVLDPFNGLATTCIEAKKLKRNYIGFEISEDYHNQAVKLLNG